MRLLHLVGLRGSDGERPRTRLDASLVLPRWISEPDREVILAFVQGIVADEFLPRVEVDCDTLLVPSDRELLRHVLLRGTDNVLLVVRVRGRGIRLDDVLSDPEISSFKHVVVIADEPLEGATVRALGHLCHLAAQTAEGTYERLIDELRLPAHGPALIAPLVRTLLNPIVVVEAFNALIRAHLESEWGTGCGRAR